jgi:GNAT superfamily N-acetyltransferase
LPWLALLCVGTLTPVDIEGPIAGVADQCERVLRTLPLWFGIESSLMEYVRDTERFPTFVARAAGEVVGFVTIRQHFPDAWEVNCIAVAAHVRNQGVGRALHTYIEQWLQAQAARLLQVKTLADSHPSAEYAETRRFYSSVGYAALEVFPELWGPRLPVLQLIKTLR